jgi:transposase-like protein
MPERRRKYTPEFKDEAAKMVVDTSRPIAEVAREIHVNEGTLGNGVTTYREAYAKPLKKMIKNWRPRRPAR